MQSDIFAKLFGHHRFVIGRVAAYVVASVCCDEAIPNTMKGLSAAKDQERRLANTAPAVGAGVTGRDYLFNVLYFTRCGVRSLPNFSCIMVS